MEKNGMLTNDSQSDFDSSKKAAYYDEAGFAVADEQHKNKLKVPTPLVAEEENQ